jgi:P4 family phage/plasmid primase-like protien
MTTAFRKFLDDYEVNDGGEWTHTSVVGGKWCIPSTATTAFHKLYAAAIDDGARLSMTERHEDACHVIVDLDSKTEHLDDGAISEFGAAMIATLKRYVNISARDRATVFRRDGSHGVHIIYPHVSVHPCIQGKMREDLVGDVARLFGPSVTYDDIATKKTPWLLHGSRKRDGTPYMPIYDVDHDGTRHECLTRTTLQWVNLLTIRPSAKEDVDGFFGALPTVVDYTDAGDAVLRAEEEKKNKKKESKQRPSGLAFEDIERLLGMIDVKKATDYNDWVNMAFALAETFKDDPEEGLRLFQVFSARAPNYDELAVDAKWRSVVQNNTGRVTFGSIKHLAKAGDPIAYDEYVDDMFERKMESATSGLGALRDGSERRVAEWIASACLAGDVVCCDATKYDCYVFGKGLWVPRRGVNLLKHDIGARMDAKIKAVIDEARKLVEEDTENEKAQDTLKRVLATAKKLDTARYLTNVMAFISGHPRVYDERFANRLDAIPHFFPCRNGMVDLRTGAVRPFEREDYVSFTVDMDFDADATCPKFDKFLDEITGGDREKAEYMQALMGYALTGSMQENVVPFIIGQGASGVSTFTKIVKEVMGGKLAINCAKDVIVSCPRQSRASNTDYERARLKGARLALFTELSREMRINSDFLSITGGDAQNARGAYQDAGEFTPTHMTLCTGNSMPAQSDAVNSANNMARRVRVIMLKVMFVDDPVAYRAAKPYTPFEIRKLDTSVFGDIISNERQGVLAWMVRGAMRWYGECGMSVESLCPQSVKDDTKAYLQRKDSLATFVEDHCYVGPHLLDLDGNTILKKNGHGLVVNACGKTELLKAYNEYRKEIGEDPVKPGDFETKLVSRYTADGVSAPTHVVPVGDKRVRGFLGISLRLV